MNEVLPFVHPVLGGLALLALAYTGSRGLLARQGGKGAHAKRRFHARYAPYAFAACAVAAVTGIATVVGVRADLSPADTWHFWSGMAVTALMTALWWLTPRRYRRNPTVRTLHPVLGVAAMVVGVGVLLFGIELLP
jgi:cytochrome bd-type quinol oxidase subunit 2